MAAQTRSPRILPIPAPLRAGAFAILALAAAGCALKEGTSPSDADRSGLVISVTDTARISLDFSDVKKTLFIDSGEYDLDEARSRMHDEGLDPDSIRITGLEVSYDDATRQFLADNEGVKFSLKIYARTDGGDTSLVLRTMESDQGELKVLAFDPDHTFYLLNQEIFGKEPGFGDLQSDIGDTTRHKVMCIAALTALQPLKMAGPLQVNLVVTVAGK